MFAKTYQWKQGRATQCPFSAGRGNAALDAVSGVKHESATRPHRSVVLVQTLTVVRFPGNAFGSENPEHP